MAKQHRMWMALVDCEGLITGYGHVIGAKRGKQCPVPAELEAEARKYMIPVEEAEASEGGVTVIPEKPVLDPTFDPRPAAILQALEAISARNDPDEFAATTGIPKVSAVRDQAALPDVSIAEVKKQWAELQRQVAEG